MAREGIPAASSGAGQGKAAPAGVAKEHYRQTRKTRFSIKYKLFVPFVLCALLLGSGGWLFMQARLDSLRDSFVREAGASKQGELTSAVQTMAERAMGEAALFSSLPEVVAAYQLAHGGNMSDETDAQAQTAREMLRRELKPALDGYKERTGQKFRLHFHLPNGRSLVRLWREKQAKRASGWVDVSDDISSFRQTVLDVNRTGESLSGIELGRGGFAIRGLSPVTDGPGGKRLGSVEVLADFDSILEATGTGEGNDLAIYMASEFLTITTQLRDPAKNPLVGEDFVTVAAPKEESTRVHVDGALLAEGAKGLAIRVVDDTALAAFPIKDYRGQVVGVAVYGSHIAAQNALIGEQGLVFGLVLLLIIGASLAIGTVVFLSTVQRPTRVMIEKIKDIAEDRADLTERLDDSRSDEMGELSHWFNSLMVKIDSIICQNETYVNLVNNIHDPMFVVDSEMKITLANRAVETFSGLPQEQLLGRPCSEIFRADVCGTPDCPIDCARRAGKTTQSEILTLTSPVTGKDVKVRPVGGILLDCRGEEVGYFEIAADVTDLAVKEEEVRRTMERMERVGREITEAAEHIAVTSDQVSRQIEQARQGSDVQSERVGATATAMEQMNATIMEVARNASSAADQADSTRRTATGGAEVVSRSISAIGRVEELTASLKESMQALGGQVEDIGRIMTVIEDIADQTNLLALNAAIEAARAGDAGRGFAVVADEVRKLAEKTMTATKEVGQAITAIQGGARENMTSMDSAVGAVAEATELVRESGEALTAIVSLVEQSADQVQAIATAAEEQSATSEEVGRAIDEVNQISSETAAGMADSAQAMARLAEQAERLRELARG